MDTRQNIRSTTAGEVLNHKGDLTIDGDVERDVVINLEEGSLEVLGNVKAGAKINLSVSDELRNLISGPAVTTEVHRTSRGGFSSTTIVSAGVSVPSVSMDVNGNIQFGSRQVSSPNATTTTIRAGIVTKMDGVTCYAGGVDINGRLQTNDVIKKLPNGLYAIVPSLLASSAADTTELIDGKIHKIRKATAIIDGKTYQGKEIRVNYNLKVIAIDGHLPETADVFSEAIQAPAAQTIPKLIIHGNLEERIIIQSDTDIECRGIIGNECQLNSKGKIKADDVLEDNRLEAVGEIVAKDIFSLNNLISEDKITVQNIASGVILRGKNGVEVQGNAGDKCNINSSIGGLKGNNFGERTTIFTRESVHIKDLGLDSVVTVSLGKFHGDSVAEGTRITARDKVHLKNAGERVKIDVALGEIIIDNQLGKSSFINARDKITISNVADSCHLTCSLGKIFSKNAGKDVSLTARDGIDIIGIGNNSSINVLLGNFSADYVSSRATISARDKVEMSFLGENSNVNVPLGRARIGDLGNNVNITARDEIIIEGRCPRSAMLNSRKNRHRAICADQDTHYYYHSPREQIVNPPQIQAAALPIEPEVAPPSYTETAGARPIAVELVNEDAPPSYGEVIQQGLFARRNSQVGSAADTSNIHHLSP